MAKATIVGYLKNSRHPLGILEYDFFNVRIKDMPCLPATKVANGPSLLSQDSGFASLLSMEGIFYIKTYLKKWDLLPPSTGAKTIAIQISSEPSNHIQI